MSHSDQHEQRAARTAYYEIRVQGELGAHWSTWFGGMAIRTTPNGDSLLRGPLADEAALHGILIKVRDLGLPLLAVSRLDIASATDQS